MVEDTTHLLEIWVAGWAGCRGYETRREGRFPAALRADTTHEWEYFAHDPSDAEFAALAAKTAEVPARILTILTNDVARYNFLAQQHGLNVTSASQTMMIVDMETQDAEDPWLSDDDLKLAPSRTDGVHHAVVRAGDEVAASGRVFVVGHTAIFDKIVTEPGFQRRGPGQLHHEGPGRPGLRARRRIRAAARVTRRAETVFAPGLDHGLPRADALRLG